MKDRSNGVAKKTAKESRLYKCIFFDLDHTLWDYEGNARETLRELHTAYNLEGMGVAFDDFHRHFRTINLELWERYDRGLIDNSVIRNERFSRVLAKFDVLEDRLSADLSREYFHGCPRKANLVPYAREVLEYLAPNYNLTIITNGFEEIQSVKLLSGDITHYFDHVITSQKAGHKKPAKEIFHYALAVNDLKCHEVLMVGDNLLTDVGGARNACIDTVYFNPAGLAHSDQVNYEIRCLSELKDLL